MKGIIASDIDGTLTDGSHSIPEEVALYLEKLHEEGWQICLVTGRAYAFARKALGFLDFPYSLILQNGAEMLSMPKEEILFQEFLSKEHLFAIDAISKDFLIYSGSERGDFCYYRPLEFSPFILSYLEKMKELVAEVWQEINSLDSIPQESFPLIKYIGTKENLKKVEASLEKLGYFSLSVIRDTISSDLYILLITAKMANKGTAIRSLAQRMGWKGPLIAAGDQTNDIPLLLEADYAIAMADADEALKVHADIIAPIAKDHGIIEGLEKVFNLLKH